MDGIRGGIVANGALNVVQHVFPELELILEVPPVMPCSSGSDQLKGS